MSSLRLLNETTVGSSVSNVKITDVFSADFDIYKITFNGTDTSADTDIDLQFVTAGGTTIRNSSDYKYGFVRNNSNSAMTQVKSDGNSKFLDFMGKGGNDSGESCDVTTYIFNPFSSDSYTYCITQSANAIVAIFQAIKGSGVFEELVSITGFQVNINSGTTTGGVIRTYGLRVDS